jgi:transposase
MNRGELTNIQWERLQPLLPPQQPQTGRPAHDPRTLLHGILWRLRTGAPWRDLPERSGPWRTVASRFYRCQPAGRWSQLLAAVQAQAEAHGQRHGDVHGIDGPMIRAHQHAAGATTGTQSPQPSAAAGAGAVPQSTGEPKGVAS